MLLGRIFTRERTCPYKTEYLLHSINKNRFSEMLSELEKRHGPVAANGFFGVQSLMIFSSFVVQATYRALVRDPDQTLIHFHANLIDNLVKRKREYLKISPQDYKTLGVFTNLMREIVDQAYARYAPRLAADSNRNLARATTPVQEDHFARTVKCRLMPVKLEDFEGVAFPSLIEQGLKDVFGLTRDKLPIAMLPTAVGLSRAVVGAKNDVSNMEL